MTGHLTRPPMPDLNGTAEQARCGLMTDAATCPACLLDLSDERDQALRARLNAWRAGFEAGRRAGFNRGYAASEAELEQRWAQIIRPAMRGRSYAEMDRRRYPPDGRAGWLLTQDGGTD